MKSNFLKIFTIFLKQINASVTATSAEKYLESHPDEGSMSAYTDALTHYNIENAAAKITVQDLKDLPKPLITFLHEDGGTFTIIKSVQNETILWLDQQKGWVQTKLEDFSKNWSGIVLFAEPDKESGEKDFKIKRKAEFLKNLRIPLAIGLISILILSSIFYSINQPNAVYSILFIKMLGMIITGLLFVKSVDSANELVNRLCSTGSKISCQSILDSPAAKITPWFSWSDAGFIYFFGSFFGLLLSLGSSDGLNTFLSIQIVFSGLAVIFSTYSLYYQGVKAKMWCTLCLGIVTIFVLEAIVLLVNFSGDGFFVDIPSILSILLGFTVPVAFLLLFKNTTIKAQESDVLQKELAKLKSNPLVFESLMAGQPQMPEFPERMPIVLLGNQNAQHTITFVSGPLCAPCAKMHLKIEALLQQDENIKCEIIFLSNPDLNDLGGQFVRKLFSLPEELRSSAMNEWYVRNDMNFGAWNAKYINHIEKPDLSRIQTSHNYWSNEAEIKGTPTLFINGRLLPEVLKVEDLTLQLSNVSSPYINDGFANHLI